MKQRVKRWAEAKQTEEWQWRMRALSMGGREGVGGIENLAIAGQRTRQERAGLQEAAASGRLRDGRESLAKRRRKDSGGFAAG